MQTSDNDITLRSNMHSLLFRDGFVDIGCGLGFILYGLGPLVVSLGISRYYLLAFYLVALHVGVRLGRRYISQPRLGVVHFPKPAYMNSRYRFHWIMAGIVLLISAVIFAKPLIGWFTDFFQDSSANLYRSGFIGSISGLAGAAWWLQSKSSSYTSRFIIYCLLVIIGDIAAHFLGKQFGEIIGWIIGFTLPGIAILILGIVILIRFMKRYPENTPLNCAVD
jgi:hypothetical protein